MTFEDNFSRQAVDYARYRPGYPDALFAWLASIAPAHDRAWDCATGSGQAALGLAPYFGQVIATDASSQQIASAVAHKGIDYVVATAEASGIDSNSVDLVTVAAALHWFDLDRFYAEAQRVLKPGGVLAAWSYNDSRITPEIDSLLKEYAKQILGDYWSPRIQRCWQGYRSIPFPFEEITPPHFTIQMQWSLDDLKGYLFTWSSTQKYIEERGDDPLEQIAERLLNRWGDPEQKRSVGWSLTAIRVGKLSHPTPQPGPQPASGVPRP